VDALDLTRAEILAAVEGAVRTQATVGPPTPASARYCATADQEVPDGMLCAVRDVMADFEVVATAAGHRPAEDRGIT
jgi:hypothetical protein